MKERSLLGRLPMGRHHGLVRSEPVSVAEQRFAGAARPFLGGAGGRRLPANRSTGCAPAGMVGPKAPAEPGVRDTIRLDAIRHTGEVNCHT